MIELAIVERPDDADVETMWDTLTDFCETDADLAALFQMYVSAESRP